MSRRTRYSGFAIALAWPQTWCRQPGSWYDVPSSWLGISTNKYYRAGHAAVVLIDSATGQCHYFDFGRYHAPFGHGRARGSRTDHELEIKTRAIVSEDRRELLNLEEILKELSGNKSCHGEGPLYGSWCRINFINAYSYAVTKQEMGAVRYGPFVRGGSNCSRFVNSTIRAGRPPLWQRLKLKYFVPLTPTTMNNVRPLKGILEIPAAVNLKPFIPGKIIDNDFLLTTLKAPGRHENIPADAQWLSGEGYGSWFHFGKTSNEHTLVRYSPSGKAECFGSFIAEEIQSIDFNKEWIITYPSDCSRVTIEQEGKLFSFFWINN